MNGDHHENGEPDRRDAPYNGSKALDELSREEILRAVAGMDERLRADADDASSILARGMLHGKLGDDRLAAEDFTRVIELEPNNTEALENRAAALATWASAVRPGRTTSHLPENRNCVNKTL